MKANSRLSRLFFPLIGLGALVWFLVRVIPKPSRATYPCQRAAFPIASGFVIYLLGPDDIGVCVEQSEEALEG